MLRVDGRGALDFREVVVARNVLPQCRGSARVVIGGGLGRGTEVLCALTGDIGEGQGGDATVDCARALWPSDDDVARKKKSEVLEAAFRRDLLGWRAAVAEALDAGSGYAWRVDVDAVVLADDGARPARKRREAFELPALCAPRGADVFLDI